MFYFITELIYKKKIFFLINRDSKLLKFKNILDLVIFNKKAILFFKNAYKYNNWPYIYIWLFNYLGGIS